MSCARVVVVGGGAAGVFGAITCAEGARAAEVIVLEKRARFLAKVAVSGGGRCNVTHACFEPRELVESYPRGRRELLGAFRTFQPSDTVEWLEKRGVALKTETDGRIFPQTDSAETVVNCLLRAARAAGVMLRSGVGVERVEKEPAGSFVLTLTGGGVLGCDRLLLATGGCRTEAAGTLPVSLGHTLAPPVPSLFSFDVETPWVRELSGVSVEAVEVSVPATGLGARGALLLTHWGVSGPAVLRLSAWGARALHALGYRFALRVSWLPGAAADEIAAHVCAERRDHPTRLVVNGPIAPLSSRLWTALVAAAGIAREKRWGELSRVGQHRLVEQLLRTELPVDGKSLNKDEFVTCGGVELREVSFKTMESRICPGLHLAGELLDIDGLTGGFNLQAAWTTGWLAGRAIARAVAQS
jgi:predicted Rossmann fold flavoprotein